jgi:hypothetical protein
MFVRAIALSIALLVGIGVIIPFATDDAEAHPHKKQRKHRHHRHYKKYSKAWWRQYHRRQRRLRAIQARKRALRLEQLRLAREHAADKDSTQANSKHLNNSKPSKTETATALPSGDPAPSGWRASQATPAELQFRIDNSSGSQVGSASISVVGPSVPGSTGGWKTVGGVSTSALRRDVIDRMIRENGWVVNDYQKEIGGQQVYVVVAQSQSKSGIQSRMFYFTEVDGRIYSVATNSPVQEAERLADESEKVINSLKSRIRPGLRSSK